MNNWGSSAIYAMIILIGIMLVSVVAAEIINNTEGLTLEQDLSKITTETIEKYSTYMDIDFKVGKFYQIDGIQKIKKIALQISPLFSTNIDITQLNVQILNKESLKLLYFDGVVEFYNGGSLFENSNWYNITEKNFGLLVINDLDKSIVDQNVINENSDRAYLIFELSDDIALSKYDSLYVTLFPGSGLSKSVILKAPMPIKPVVIFE